MLKSRIAFLILIIIILALSCHDDKANINGHWHSVFPDQGAPATLDIGDSTIIANKYDLTRNNYLEWIREDPVTKKIYIPLTDFEYTDKYQLSGDTLIVGHDIKSHKYLRSNIIECEINDRYSEIFLKIRLPDVDEFKNYQNSKYNDTYGNIFVSLESNGNYSVIEEIKNLNPDSILINVFDILINIKGIKGYCDEVKEYTSYFVIHADKKVNELFINKIVQQIPENYNVSRAVSDQNGSLKVIKLR